MTSCGVPPRPEVNFPVPRQGVQVARVSSVVALTAATIAALVAAGTLGAAAPQQLPDPAEHAAPFPLGGRGGMLGAVELAGPPSLTTSQTPATTRELGFFLQWLRRF